MEQLRDRAERIAALLKARGERVGVAESSTGGLVSAALLAVPGASAYFLGGAVIYTRHARAALLGIDPARMEAALAGMRPSTEPYAALLATRMRERLGAAWGLGESGAAGPGGNSYGDAAGHACLAVSGPVIRTATIETGSTDRAGNMRHFAASLLDLFVVALEAT